MAFSIVTLLSSLTIGYMLLKQSEEIITNKTEEELIRLSQEGSKRISLELEAEKEKLNIIAGIDSIKSMDLEAQIPILKDQIEYTDFTDIGIIKPGGETYFSDGTVFNMVDEEYVKSAFNGKSGVSEIIVDDISKNVSLMFTLPIESRGNIVGVIIGKRDGYDLSAITDSIKYHEEGYSYIIDKKGTDIAHPDRKFVERANNSFELLENDESLESVVDAFKVVLEEEMGTNEYSYDGEHYNIGYASIDGTDWKMIVAANVNEVLGSIISIQNRITFIIAFIVIANILIMYYIGRRLTRPIVKTKNNSFKVSPHRTYEIESLTASIESISLSIKDRIKEISFSLDQLATDSPRLTEDTKLFDIDSEKSFNANSVIVAIAEETNLLALNAAIEAARVGQIGKKFTVSVKKVKKIVQQSSVSANEMHKVIENLISHISQVEITIQKVSKITLEQIANVNNSENKDISISEFTKESYKYIKELDEAQTEINEVKDLILDSLQTVGQIVQDHSDADREVKAIAQNQYITTEEVVNAGKNLEILVDDLNSIIIKSKLRL